MVISDVFKGLFNQGKCLSTEISKAISYITSKQKYHIQFGFYDGNCYGNHSFTCPGTVNQFIVRGFHTLLPFDRSDKREPLRQS